jgi:hypothetical protein
LPKNAENGISEGHNPDHIFQKHTDFASLADVWPNLEKHIKEEILRMAGLSGQRNAKP